MRLFAEKAKPVNLAELDMPSDWDSSVMLVAVSLDIKGSFPTVIDVVV